MTSRVKTLLTNSKMQGAGNERIEDESFLTGSKKTKKIFLYFGRLCSVADNKNQNRNPSVFTVEQSKLFK